MLAAKEGQGRGGLPTELLCTTGTVRLIIEIEPKVPGETTAKLSACAAARHSCASLSQSNIGADIVRSRAQDYSAVPTRRLWNMDVSGKARHWAVDHRRGRKFDN